MDERSLSPVYSSTFQINIKIFLKNLKTCIRHEKEQYIMNQRVFDILGVKHKDRRGKGVKVPMFITLYPCYTSCFVSFHEDVTYRF